MRRTASILICIVLALVSVGLVMITSASGEIATSRFNQNEFFFLKRQLIWLPVALVSGLVVALVDYRHWKKLCIPAFLATLVLLSLVFVPGIRAENSSGEAINGSWRWLEVAGLRLQPSEFAKFTFVVIIAWWVSENVRYIHQFVRGLVVPLGLMGAVLLLVIAEPDFGTTMLLAVVGMSIMYVGGTRVSYLAVTAVLGFSTLSVLIMQNAERASRILAFIDPEKHPDKAFHLQQSLASFTLGGPWGVGLGQSIQKAYYLPEAHTDFILAIIAEELGFVGTGCILVLFLGLAVCGMRISLYAPDLFGKLLGFGFTFLVTMQAAINVGVVTGCLPTKGIALPFISYGGSSLVMSVVFVCVLINISRFAVVPKAKETSQIKDRDHRF